ncbi:hypothetical protein JXI42_07790 [bacterium]|nr:hypothetical protein [bacterium]
MLKLVFKSKLKLLFRAIFKKEKWQTAKIIVGFIVLGIFFGGSYWFFHSIFAYLVTVENIGVLLIDKVISIGFLAFGIMLIISNIVISISTLFRSSETQYLLATPLSYQNVFFVKFFDNIFYSSWATLIVGIPLFAAYCIVHNIAWFYYPILAIVVFIPFLLIPAYVGTVLSMFFYLIAKKIKPRWTALLFVLIGAGAIFAYLKTSFSPQLLLNVEGNLYVLNYYIRQLGTASFPYLPNVWISEALKSIRHGSFSDFVFYSLCLISTCAAGWVIVSAIVKRLYYPSWLAAAEVSGKRDSKSKDLQPQRGFLWKILFPFPKDMRALMVKDIKLFLRSPNQWSQFTILMVLLILYLLNLRIVPRHVDERFWQTVTSFGNFAFCGYILATLSVRFVYPSISLEGKNFWSILSSPMSYRRLFWEKFWIAFIIFFTLAEFVAIVSNVMLAQSGFMMFLTAIGILLMSISLTSLAVGLGIIFPSFEEDNPGKIASSGGGMITALVSLVYVGIVVIVLALPTHQYTSYLVLERSFPMTNIIIAFVITILVNVAATVIPLKLGLNAIKKIED